MIIVRNYGRYASDTRVVHNREEYKRIFYYVSMVCIVHRTRYCTATTIVLVIDAFKCNNIVRQKSTTRVLVKVLIDLIHGILLFIRIEYFLEATSLLLEKVTPLMCSKK